jgi:hypothetical protein
VAEPKRDLRLRRGAAVARAGLPRPLPRISCNTPPVPRLPYSKRYDDVLGLDEGWSTHVVCLYINKFEASPERKRVSAGLSRLTILLYYKKRLLQLPMRDSKNRHDAQCISRAGHGQRDSTLASRTRRTGGRRLPRPRCRLLWHLIGRSAPAARATERCSAPTRHTGHCDSFTKSSQR